MLNDAERFVIEPEFPGWPMRFIHPAESRHSFRHACLLRWGSGAYKRYVTANGVLPRWTYH